jgi:hypothetical protein
MRYEKIGEWEYVGLDALTIGDYGGGGAAAVANQRAIDAAIAAGEATSAGSVAGCNVEGADAEGADVVILMWPHGGREYLIRCDDGASDWAREMVESLEQYPVLDEEEWSSVEGEWEEEALPDVLLDLRRLFSESGRDAWDDVEEEEQGELFRSACEETNTYWEHEYASAWIDVRRLVRAPSLAPYLAE